MEVSQASILLGWRRSDILVVADNCLEFLCQEVATILSLRMIRQTLCFTAAHYFVLWNTKNKNFENSNKKARSQVQVNIIVGLLQIESPKAMF